ncbi:MAG: hypothetical protein LBO71_00060 [Prevotellaceae bacterium]|jgi:hypothetical protein|nr:hypothetical protein [Prevotellaceae bacterium]
MKVSEKYYTEIFDFKGQWDMPSKCGLRIAATPRKTFVVVTELYQDNPGTSVTNAGRSLAEQICRSKGLALEEIAYIECNPDTNSKLSFYDEELYEVAFRDAQPPTYRLLTRDEVKALLDNRE